MKMHTFILSLGAITACVPVMSANLSNVPSVESDRSSPTSSAWVSLNSCEEKNVIVCENERTDVPLPQSVTARPRNNNCPAWELCNPNPPRDLEGFVKGFSVDKNDGFVDFYIQNHTSKPYWIEIYRMGYYKGRGARRVTTLTSGNGIKRLDPQPPCHWEEESGLHDCLSPFTKNTEDRWHLSARWPVPDNLPSGVYLAKTNNDQGISNHILFVVRDDNSMSDMLFQTSDTTWQAYNEYIECKTKPDVLDMADCKPKKNRVGASLYRGNGGPATSYNKPNRQSGYKASYHRPLQTRYEEETEAFFRNEFPMLYWLEMNGYDISYIGGIDVNEKQDRLLLDDQQGRFVRKHKVFLSVGHDEYWSGRQREAVTSARDWGVHLAFFSGNEVFWKTYFEVDPNNSTVKPTTMVTYKESINADQVKNNCSSNNGGANKFPDLKGHKPPKDSEWTGPWYSCNKNNKRCMQFGPQNELTGQIGYCKTVSIHGDTGHIAVPPDDKKYPIWRNTFIAGDIQDQLGDSDYQLLGYEMSFEWTHDDKKNYYPNKRVQMSHTAFKDMKSIKRVHSLSLYPHEAKDGMTALVFGAGTIQWSWGLGFYLKKDGTCFKPDYIYAARDVHDIQQATMNILSFMEAFPASPQSNLVLIGKDERVDPLTPDEKPIYRIADIDTNASDLTLPDFCQ